MEILKAEEGSTSPTYLSALPDTKVWRKSDLYMEPYVTSYFSHPSYADYPVVGLTHAQAGNYCKWRTQAVSKMLTRLNVSAPENFIYRLPTRIEWELVAEAGYDKKQQKLIAKKIDKFGESAKLYNMRFSEEGSDYNPSLYAPAPARSHLPNKHGIYNLHGNIAEMVAEPGIAVGGSFRHYHNEIVPTNMSLSYEEPQDWLGFRCVCEIIEK